MKRIALLLLAALLCCGCGGGEELRLLILKSGKSDAIILHTAGAAVLVDTGEDDDGGKILKAAAERGIDRFDYMVITHYDKDHVGGAAEVIEGMEVGCIIEPGYPKDSKAYRAFERAAESRFVPRETLTHDRTIELDGMRIELLAPKKSGYEDENDHSIVIRAAYGKYTALLTGDALDERTAELEQYDLSADILKVPHHGSFEEGSSALFERVSPSYAVITCSNKNPADERTVAALKDAGARVFITAAQDIEFAFSHGGSVLEVLPILPGGEL